MNVTTFLGSPRKQGNTAFVLKEFEDMATNSGHTVKRINMMDHRVNGCLECYECQKSPNAPGCVQKDDFQDIIETMGNSDLIIYGSPLFGWDVSAQLKPLLDRHFCFVKGFQTPGYWSFLENKTLVMLITCAGPKEVCDLVENFFNRFSHYLKRGYHKTYTVPFSMNEDFHKNGVSTAEQMATDLL